jgi:hypothetical protein
MSPAEAAARQLVGRPTGYSTEPPRRKGSSGGVLKGFIMSAPMAAARHLLGPTLSPLHRSFLAEEQHLRDFEVEGV